MKITPIKKIKEGSRGVYYEVKVNCTVLSIIILDDENGSPCSIRVQNKKGKDFSGGCVANIEAVQRLVTLLLECNIKEDLLIEQLNKVHCSSCVGRFRKGEKDIALSCAKAIAGALEKHLYNGNNETQKKE